MSAGDKMVAGVMTLPAEVCDAGGRPGWVGYIGADDVDAATAGVEKAGGAVTVRLKISRTSAASP